MTVVFQRHQMMPLNSPLKTFEVFSFGPVNIQQHKPGKTIPWLKKGKSRGKKINQNLTSLWLLSLMSSEDWKGYFRPGFNLMEQQGSSFLLDPWNNHVWWNHCGHICWNLPSFRICFKRRNLSVLKGHNYFPSPSLVPGTMIRHQSIILDPPNPECFSQLLPPCACLVGQPLGTVNLH